MCAKSELIGWKTMRCGRKALEVASNFHGTSLRSDIELHYRTYNFIAVIHVFNVTAERDSL